MPESNGRPTSPSFNKPSTGTHFDHDPGSPSSEPRTPPRSMGTTQKGIFHRFLPADLRSILPVPCLPALTASSTSYGDTLTPAQAWLENEVYPDLARNKHPLESALRQASPLLTRFDSDVLHRIYSNDNFFGPYRLLAFAKYGPKLMEPAQGTSPFTLEQIERILNSFRPEFFEQLDMTEAQGTQIASIILKTMEDLYTCHAKLATAGVSPEEAVQMTTFTLTLPQAMLYYTKAGQPYHHVKLALLPQLITSYPPSPIKHFLAARDKSPKFRDTPLHQQIQLTLQSPAELFLIKQYGNALDDRRKQPGSTLESPSFLSPELDTSYEGVEVEYITLCHEGFTPYQLQAAVKTPPIDHPAVTQNPASNIKILCDWGGRSLVKQRLFTKSWLVNDQSWRLKHTPEANSPKEEIDLTCLNNRAFIPLLVKLDLDDLSKVLKLGPSEDFVAAICYNALPPKNQTKDISQAAYPETLPGENLQTSHQETLPEGTLQTSHQEMPLEGTLQTSRQDIPLEGPSRTPRQEMLLEVNLQTQDPDILPKDVLKIRHNQILPSLLDDKTLPDPFDERLPLTQEVTNLLNTHLPAWITDCNLILRTLHRETLPKLISLLKLSKPELNLLTQRVTDFETLQTLTQFISKFASRREHKQNKDYLKEILTHHPDAVLIINQRLNELDPKLLNDVFDSGNFNAQSIVSIFLTKQLPLLNGLTEQQYLHRSFTLLDKYGSQFKAAKYSDEFLAACYQQSCLPELGKFCSHFQQAGINEAEIKDLIMNLIIFSGFRAFNAETHSFDIAFSDILKQKILTKYAKKFEKVQYSPEFIDYCNQHLCLQDLAEYCLDFQKENINETRIRNTISVETSPNEKTDAHDEQNTEEVINFRELFSKLLNLAKAENSENSIFKRIRNNLVHPSQIFQ